MRHILCVLAFVAFENKGAAQDFTPEIGEVGLINNYGFVANFQKMDEGVIRHRIRNMVTVFGVKDFQFYDWFASYSSPTSGDCWKDAFFGQREICLETIKIMIDEIHTLGGRAWAYVQAVGAEESDLSIPGNDIYKLIDENGIWYWHEGRFPTYFANGSWARHMVNIWADAIAKIGFDGIHWDTLGTIAGSYSAEKAGIHSFIGRAASLLAEKGLKQTFNFVNLAWWSPVIVAQHLEFAYAEVWDMMLERKYYQELTHPMLRKLRGVMAFYPSVYMPDGWTESEVMIARWKEAARHNASYLVVGDGLRRLKHLYFPDNVPLTDSEIIELTQH